MEERPLTTNRLQGSFHKKTSRAEYRQRDVEWDEEPRKPSCQSDRRCPTCSSADEVTACGSPVFYHGEHLDPLKNKKLYNQGLFYALCYCFVYRGHSVNLGQGWNLSSSPIDDDRGDYGADKISAQLITKEACQLLPGALILPGRKPFGVLIPPLLPSVWLVNHSRDKRKKVAHCVTENAI